jgi:SAM-dependent methyltransferase
MDRSDYSSRLAAEKITYHSCLDVHNLPDIFHYWSNRYVRPKLEAFGFSAPDDMFRKYALEQSTVGRSEKRIVSLGSGNCQMEIDLALHLLSYGHSDFVIDCLELNTEMLERGRNAAAKAGLSNHLTFIQADLNQWDPTDAYDLAIASQTLHHILNLERVIGQVKRSLRPSGRFLISDMIGRNGHQRWPEALDLVQEFWRQLPPSYRFNPRFGRYEERYENWDCSVEGFEGIRAQDILPLLIESFHFELFIVYANIIDPFVDRGFGNNFDAAADWDRSFIDRVSERDEAEIHSGRISPTHMVAVIGNDQTIPLSFHDPLTPKFCVRSPSRVIVSAPALDPSDAYEWGAWPHSDRSQLEFVCGQLHESLARVEVEKAIAEERTAWALGLDREIVGLGQQVTQLQEELKGRTEWVRQVERELEGRTAWSLRLNRELEERTAWAFRIDRELKEQSAWVLHLEQDLKSRTAWAFQIEEELKDRTNWALQLDAENRKQSSSILKLTGDIDRLAWAQPLDRWFHKLLDGAFRMFRRALRGSRLKGI